MPNNRRFVSMLLALIITFFHGSRSCGEEQTVPGPESDELATIVAGYVLLASPPDGISAIRLPTLEKIIVRPASPRNDIDMPTVHSLSGPDAEGQIAYVEDHFFVANESQQRHLLKSIKLDGKRDTELFTRSGNAMWATSAAGKGEIGKHLALSMHEGRVAFLSGLVPIQMPSALLNEGSMEVWNLEEKAGRKFSVKRSRQWADMVS